MIKRSALDVHPVKPLARLIRVVAFDLGGVVVDVDHAVLSALGERDAVDAALHGDGRHDDVSTGRLSGEGFAAAAAIRLGCSAADVIAAWQRVVRFSPGGRELVAETAAAGPVVIWSNTDPMHWAVVGAPLEAVATDVAPSFVLGVMKPDPAFYELALKRLAHLGIVAGDVLFVDDRADNVAAARALGVQAVRVRGVDEARAAIARARR